ncbi:AEC family transporter [Archangium sp.]|uniref:AEC family transporter n=1 Tax=Archangium sp. TaxID=1872627 RepID=UPI002D5AAB67|nr:AEC family transporter [Archangium sp.]HYO53638.1 AEC family transporter [Archangium sp.]
MNQLVGLLAASILLGAVARRSGRFPEQTALALNAFVLNVALPALVLRAVHRLTLAPELLVAAATPWLVFGGAWLFFRVLGPRLGFPPDSVAALVLTGGLGNTAFVGLPLIEGLVGRDGLRVAVVIDQLGSFLVLGTVATLFAARAAAKDTRPVALLKKVVGFPPLLALVAAFLAHPWDWPAWVDVVLGRLGDLLTPLALFSVGFQLRPSGVKGRVRALALGLGYKLVLAPLGIALLLLALPGMGRLSFEVSVLQAAMAPMVTGAILAADNGLDPELCALMVGLGIPLSFATVPCALWLMR